MMNSFASRGDYVRPPRPVFAPRLSLGWKLGPLDGLSSYLRCVEAVLRTRGYTREDIAFALLQPLDPLRDATNGSSFAHCRVEWTVDQGKDERWAEIKRRLVKGPLLVSLNSYEWPSHEFFRGDHVALLSEMREGQVLALDIDAPAADGYTRRLSPEVVRAAASGYGSVAVVDGSPVQDAESVFRCYIAPGIRRLESVATSLFDFERSWRLGTLPDGFARAVQVVALDDVQPQFLTFEVCLAHAAVPELRVVSARAAEVRRQAHQLGLELRAEHKDPNMPRYLRSKAALNELGRAFVVFGDAAKDAARPLGTGCGLQVTSPRDRFRRRIASLVGLGFDEREARAGREGEAMSATASSRSSRTVGAESTGASTPA